MRCPTPRMGSEIPIGNREADEPASRLCRAQHYLSYRCCILYAEAVEVPRKSELSMEHEIELVNDGDSVAVFGDSNAVA